MPLVADGSPPCGLEVLPLLHLILRIALDILVAALLVEGLRFEQVAHGAGAGVVVVGLQAEVLRSLADGLDGYLHLLVGVGHGVPRVLHVDDQQFAAVAQAVLVVAHGQAGTLHVVAAFPPAAEGDAYGGEAHPEGFAAVGQVVVHEAAADGHRREVPAYAYLPLYPRCLEPGLQQVVFRRECERGFRRAIEFEGRRGQRVGHLEGDVHAVAGRADVLCQQAARQGEGVLDVDARAAGVVLPELYLEQVVAVGDAGADGGIHVLMYLGQLRLDHAERAELLLQHGHLPEVLLGGEAHLVFGLAAQEAVFLDVDLGQLVALHNLSSGEEGQRGIDAAHQSVLQHLHAHAGGDVHLQQVLVGHEAHAGGADGGEVLGEGAFPLLFGHAEVVGGVLHACVVAQGLLYALVQRVGLLGGQRQGRQAPGAEQEDIFASCMSHFFQCYGCLYSVSYSYLRGSSQLRLRGSPQLRLRGVPQLRLRGVAPPIPRGVVTPVPLGVVTPIPRGVVTPVPRGVVTPIPLGVVTPTRLRVRTPTRLRVGTPTRLRVGPPPVLLLLQCIPLGAPLRAAPEGEQVQARQDGQDEQHRDERAVADDRTHRHPQARLAQYHRDDAHRSGGRRQSSA